MFDTIVHKEKIDNIKDIVQNKINHLEGDFIEIGVYNGGSGYEIFLLLQEGEHLYLCDTFEGIPYSNSYDNIHVKGDFNDVDYDKIKKFYLDKNNVTILKGIFPDETSDNVKDKKFKFVHLDVDVYDSYFNCLSFLYDKVVVGGYLVFDDYGASTCEGATKAVNDFFKNRPENIKNIGKSYFVIKE